MWLAAGHKSGHPNKTEIAWLEKIVPVFCNEKENRSDTVFDLTEFDSFIIRNFLQVRPHRSNVRKSEVKTKYSGKSPLDTQNSCYHLSDKNPQYHIKCIKCRKQINPFRWIDDITYSLKPTWSSQNLCSCVST